MLNILMNPSQDVLIGLMFLASLRIYLEIVGFDLLKLPMTRFLADSRGEDNLRRFHRMGLVFSVGFILLFAPQLILQ